MEQTKKQYKKKADLNTKTGKYFLAKKAGKNKEEAKETALYAPSTTTTSIEKTKSYEAIEKKYYIDHLDAVISPEQVAQAHADNILQEKDKGARNKAIEMYKSYKEPDEQSKDAQEQVVIIFKQ